MATKAQTQPSEAKRIYWRGVLDSWRSSGLEDVEFCRRHALPIKKFRWWRTRLQSQFIPVRLNGAENGAEETPSLEVVLANGRAVRVAPGFDAETLVRVIDVLEAPPCG